MDFNSPLFDKIRIRPADEEVKVTKEPSCQHPGCQAAGKHRAPKGRAHEGQYWLFCLEHVRAYNQTYNYFTGMNDEAVVAYQKDASIGHRPTWSMGVNAKARSTERGGRDAESWSYDDPLQVLRAAGVNGRRSRAAEPPARKFSAPVRQAYETLGLEEGANAAAIKTQYKTLVKRFHPDAHGGDRSYEERLKAILRAHDTLKAAGLC